MSAVSDLEQQSLVDAADTLLDRYADALIQGETENRMLHDAAVLGCLVVSEAQNAEDAWYGYLAAGLEQRGVTILARPTSKYKRYLQRTACANVEPAGTYSPAELLGHLLATTEEHA